MANSSHNREQLEKELASLKARVRQIELELGLEAEHFGMAGMRKELERLSSEHTLEYERLSKLLKLEIAERETLEEQLRVSKQQLKNSFHSSQIGVYRATPDGRFLSANQALAVMLGFETATELMANITDIQAQLYVNPQDRSAGLASAHATPSETISRVVRWRRNDGEIIWVQLDKHPVFDEDGSIQFYEAMVKDVTESTRIQEELKTSEQRLKTVADYTFDWEYWRAPNGELIWISPSCERITGYTAEEFMENPSLLQMLVVPDDLRAWDSHVQAEALQAPTHTFDFRIRTKNGELRWIGHNCHAVYDDDGNFLGRRASNQDITVRKQHERELSEQFTFIQTLIDAAPTPIFYKDLDGVYLGCNTAFAEHLGMPRDQIIGRSVHDLERDEDAAVHAAIDLEILAEPRQRTYLHTEVSGKRGERTVIVNKAPFTSSTGKVTGIIGVLTDITEQQRTQEQLRKLTQAVEQSPISIVITDTRGTIEYVNPYFCSLTGYTSEEAIGGNPNILKSGRHEPQHYRDLWRTIHSGKQWQGEFINRKRSGELYWEKSIIAPIKDEHGKVTHFVAVKEDITDRKHAEEQLRRSEARYRQVVEGTDNIITQLDAHGRFTYLNRAAELFYGLPEGTWRGISVFESTHPEERPALREALRKLTESEDRRILLENRQLGSDGEYHTLELNIQLHRNDDGDLVAVSIIGRDVTEQKKLEQLKHDVEKITRHDLKSPLMGIISVPQLLMDAENLTEEQRNLLAAIEESGFRMLSMINLSLDLYKMEMGTYQFQPATIDLLPVVRKVADDVTKAMQVKDITVEVLVSGAPPEPGARFRAVAEELLCYSLFSNLVMNAAEASPEDGRVTLDLQNEHGLALIAIHNQGEVPKNIRSHFFDKYVTAGKAKGTGLGTYSARLIAETQNGSVELTSTGEEGTTITVSLRAPL